MTVIRMLRATEVPELHMNGFGLLTIEWNDGPANEFSRTNDLPASLMIRRHCL